MAAETHLDPSDEAVLTLFARGISGPVTMLNLLRLRDVADYSDFPGLAPAAPVSGKAAYLRYVEHTLPFLEDSGGALLYLGEGGEYLIGPEGEGWDLAMLVRQNSLDDFLAFAGNEDYLQGIGHRTAAVRDSRLLPLVDVDRSTGSASP